MNSIIYLVELGLFIYISIILLSNKDKQTKFLWMFAGYAFLHPFFKMPILPIAPMWFPICVTYKAWRDKELKSLWKNYPLRWITLAFFIYHVIHPLFYYWQGFGISFYREIQEFIWTYYLLFVGFILCPSNWNWDKAIVNIERIALVLISISFLVQIVHANFISLAFSSTGETMYEFDTDSTRGFRDTGTQFSPNIFGIINVVVFLLIFYFEKNVVRRWIYLSFLFLVIVFTATRAPLVMLIMSFMTYYALKSKTKLLSILLLFLPLVFIAGNIIPQTNIVGQYLSGVLDIFATGGQNTDGSSMELRENQWETALFISADAPFMGHGAGYTNNLINENGIFSNIYKGGLAGAEGYQYYLVIDYGIIYFFMFIIFFASLFFFFFKGYRRNKELSIFGFMFTIFELAFLLSSRPQNSWQMILPFVGLFMKMLYDYNAKASTYKMD